MDRDLITMQLKVGALSKDVNRMADQDGNAVAASLFVTTYHELRKEAAGKGVTVPDEAEAEIKYGALALLVNQLSASISGRMLQR